VESVRARFNPGTPRGFLAGCLAASCVAAAFWPAAAAPAPQGKGPSIDIVQGGNFASTIVDVRHPDGFHLYYVVEVEVAFSGCAPGDQIWCRVYDENGGEWAWMDPVGAGTPYHTVPAGGAGSARFSYPIQPLSDWDLAIWTGQFPMAAVEAQYQAEDIFGNWAVSRTDSDWVYLP
jgi:hypothetical protein